MPPLIKGRQHAGAKLLGEPRLDAEFGCADLPMVLHIDALGPRHRRRFLR